MENLFEGADYLFRVFAENKVGASQKAAELQIPIRAKMPYGKNWAASSINDRATRFAPIAVFKKKKKKIGKIQAGKKTFIVHLAIADMWQYGGGTGESIKKIFKIS